MKKFLNLHSMKTIFAVIGFLFVFYHTYQFGLMFVDWLVLMWNNIKGVQVVG